MGKVDTMPAKAELMEAIITTMDSCEGRASTGEIDSAVATLLNLSDELLSQKDENSLCTAYSYRMRWAKTALKEEKKLANPERGVWELVRE